MPDVPMPTWIFSDAQPGYSNDTNQAMPRFGGMADPGQTIRISVDGETTGIAPTPSGTWEYTGAELPNGDHDYEMWTEDADGNRSDPITWTDSVDASERERAVQRARNAEWEQSGRRQFLDANDRLAAERAASDFATRYGEPWSQAGASDPAPLTPPRPIATGGSGAPPTAVATGGTGNAGVGSATGARTATGGGIVGLSGLEKGNVG